MKSGAGLLFGLIAILCAALSPAWADVLPGDVVDKASYQKIEGLVPEFVLEWVKNGDLKMKIGELTYDSKKYWSQEVLDNWQGNSSRYKVDEHNGIIDSATGKPARGIKGIPFPETDPADPRMPMKLMWNTEFSQYYHQGNLHEMQFWLSLARSGLEKTVQCEHMSLIYDPAKSQYDRAELSVFRAPFNMAGTGSLDIIAMYPLDPSIRYGYAPELRRVKRLAHKLTGSQENFGFEQAPDDTWAGGPRTAVEEGIYKFVAEKDALVPYLSAGPLVVPWTEKGDLDVGNSATGLALETGFETQGWTGAPWHFTNIIWVKSRVFVIESRSTDPNYAYGPCEGWIEKGTFSNCYKRITDSNGKLWKGAYWVALGVGTQEGKYRMIDNIASVVVDVRRDHGSAYPLAYRKGGFKKMLKKDTNESLFTESGFMKLTQ